MNKDRLYLKNIPDHPELKRLGEKHYGSDFPRRYNKQSVPVIQAHFDANTPKEMVEQGLIDELVILLEYMVGEKTADHIDNISHTLSKILIKIE